MYRRGDRHVEGDFRVRRGRQLAAIGLALFLVFFLAVIHGRPTVLGELSKNAVSGAQVIVIAAFMGFTGLNWRCPSCKKFLGSDIETRTCKHCKSRLR